MARPRKFYIYFVEGYARTIIEGSKAAKLAKACVPHRTRLAAEEYASWHNYQRAERETREKEALHARLAAKGYAPLDWK